MVYVPTVWGPGDLITIAKGNNWETQYDEGLKVMKLWVQPHVASGVGSVLSSAGLGYASSEFANNQNDSCDFTIPIPTGFSTVSKAVIRIIPVATGNLYLSVATRWAAVGEAQDANTDTIAVAAYAVVASQMYEYDMAAALTGIAAGDTVGINFVRTGADALDTSEGIAYILGVLLECS